MHTRSRLLQRWLLVLAVVAGLIGMHHLIAHSPVAPGPSAQSSAGPGPLAGPGLVTVSSPIETHRAPAPAASMTMSGPSDRVHGGVGTAMDPAANAAMDMAMHACLAVLAALIVLGLLAAVAEVLDPGRGVTFGIAARWARPPPRTAVRLAQLCVLRN